MTNPPGFFTGTEMPDPGWWEALWSDPAKVIADVGITPGMAMVDLCSGDGWFTLQLGKVARSVLAIDIDGKLLATARIRLAEAGLSNCTFVQADAYEIDKTATTQVDHVFLANAFHGVPDKPALAAAVRKVLRAGGLFAIVSWHARPRDETPVLGEPRGPATDLRMTPQQTVQAVEPSGLKHRYTVEIPPYHYGAIFEKVQHERMPRRYRQPSARHAM